MNSSSSQNPYQHYRKKSPTTYDDIIDPYRVHKSRPSDTNTLEQEILHSRTASDSSTSRLATNGATYSHVLTSRDYDDDPYALSRIPHNSNNNSNNNSTNNNNDNSNNNDNNSSNNVNINNDNHHDTQYDNSHKAIPTVNPYYDSFQQRANSYLPYSHHQRDPTQPIAPIYIEDDQQHHLNGVGSMLQDNLSVDMASQNEPRRLRIIPNADDEKYAANMMNQREKRPLQRIWYGLTLRTWLLMVSCSIILIALLLFFLVPRMPTVSFSAADTTQRQSWSGDKNTMTAQWYVNMTVDNSQNWIPTWLQQIIVNVADNDTGIPIGSGTGSPQWLAPRNSQQLISLPINISYTGKNATDETIIDLFATCGPQVTLAGPVYYKPEYFNVTFDIDLYIQGVPWSSRTTITPRDGIQCPA